VILFVTVAFAPALPPAVLRLLPRSAHVYRYLRLVALPPFTAFTRYRCRYVSTRYLFVLPLLVATLPLRYLPLPFGALRCVVTCRYVVTTTGYRVVTVYVYPATRLQLPCRFYARLVRFLRF